MSDEEKQKVAESSMKVCPQITSKLLLVFLGKDHKDVIAQ